MIQGIQNVSFAGGMQSKVVDNAAKKVGNTLKNLEETFVSASSNLTGTVNSAKAERFQRDMKVFTDKNTLLSRVASLTNSRRTVPAEEIAKSAARSKSEKAAAMAEAAKGEAERLNAISEFNYFG